MQTVVLQSSSVLKQHEVWKVYTGDIMSKYKIKQRSYDTAVYRLRQLFIYQRFLYMSRELQLYDNDRLSAFTVVQQGAIAVVHRR